MVFYNHGIEGSRHCRNIILMFQWLFYGIWCIPNDLSWLKSEIYRLQNVQKAYQNLPGKDQRFFVVRPFLYWETGTKNNQFLALHDVLYLKLRVLQTTKFLDWDIEEAYCLYMTYLYLWDKRMQWCGAINASFSKHSSIWGSVKGPYTWNDFFGCWS